MRTHIYIPRDHAEYPRLRAAARGRVWRPILNELAERIFVHGRKVHRSEREHEHRYDTKHNSDDIRIPLASRPAPPAP